MRLGWHMCPLVLRRARMRAGYNASRMNDETIKPKALIGVLPLFSDKAATPAIMKHAMQLTMEDMQFLNQG